jgi:hypothetical protein
MSMKKNLSILCILICWIPILVFSQNQVVTNVKMIPINTQINTFTNPQLQLTGNIVFIKYNNYDSIIEGTFTTNHEFTINIPDDTYYVYAWIPKNTNFSKTYYGSTLIWDSITNPCDFTLLPKPMQFSTSQNTLHIDLLEYYKITVPKKNTITVTVENKRSIKAPGRPIRDVDVTLVKVPPARAAICQSSVIGNAYYYKNLEMGKYYLHLDVPGLYMKNNRCLEFTNTSSNSIPVKLIVKDDGIYVE